jgi:hypothetical protein
MPYEFYKVLHFISLFALFMSLGGLIMAYSQNEAIKKPWRAIALATHGVALLVLLVSGFGLAARLGLVGGLPSWIYLKLAIWLVMGALIVVIRKATKFRVPLFFLVLALGGAAAWVAVNKP